MSNKKIILLVVSGFGVFNEYKGNPLFDLLNFRSLISDFPATSLRNNTIKTSESFKILGGDKDKNISEVISENKLKQLKIADSEKFGYLSYFFNNKKEEKLNNEDKILITKKAENKYIEDPEGSIDEITKKIIFSIENNEYDFILANFSELDYLAHLGDLEALKISAKKIDESLGKIAKAVLTKKDAILAITSDHGNAENMINMQTEEINTQHTSNNIPFVLVSQDFEGKNLGWNEFPDNDLSLCEPVGDTKQIAPTILHLMGLGNKDKSLI